jgi:hypothetical protein
LLAASTTEPDYFLTIAYGAAKIVIGEKQKAPIIGAFHRADEGTRTLDLLHGKDTARGDSN